MVGIGFFAPLPLALMLPFMAGQSMLMGDAFGKAYQYGKRKISAMSNEEFNKLSPSDLSNQIVTDYSQMIPSLSTAVKNSQAFQSLIITELTKIARSIPADVISGLTEGSPNPVTTLTQQATSQAPIDYGQIALAVIKNLLGPIGSSFIPTPVHADPGHLPPSTLDPNRPTTLDQLTGDTQIDTTAAEHALAQAKLQFQKYIETTTDADIIHQFNNLSKFPNWKKSLITEQYNKRNLNPKNQTLTFDEKKEQQEKSQDFAYQDLLDGIKYQKAQYTKYANIAFHGERTYSRAEWTDAKTRVRSAINYLYQISLKGRDANRNIAELATLIKQERANGKWKWQY